MSNFEVIPKDDLRLAVVMRSAERAKAKPFETRSDLVFAYNALGVMDCLSWYRAKSSVPALRRTMRDAGLRNEDFTVAWHEDKVYLRRDTNVEAQDVFGT